MFFKPKNFQVRLKTPLAEHVMTVSSKETLLRAFRREQLEVKFDCQVGSCGACKARLLRGEIKELKDSAFVLNKEQIQAGWFLPCQSLARSDLELETEPS